MNKNIYAGKWRDESFKSSDSEGALASAREASLLEYELRILLVFLHLHILIYDQLSAITCYLSLATCPCPLCGAVLAEDAIKSALKDYKLKREKNGASARAKSSPPDAKLARAAA